MEMTLDDILAVRCLRFDACSYGAVRDELLGGTFQHFNEVGRLVFDRPDDIRKFHRQSILAGADVIRAFTHDVCRWNLPKGHTAGEIIARAVAIAREEAELMKSRLGRQVFVAGKISVCPETIHFSLNPQFNVHYDLVVEDYRIQVEAFQREGIDLLVAEQVMEFDNFFALHDAIAVSSQTKPPLFVDFLYEVFLRCFWGALGPIETLKEHLGGRNVFSVGISRYKFIPEIADALRTLRASVPFHIHHFPCGGLHPIHDPPHSREQIADFFAAQCWHSDPPFDSFGGGPMFDLDQLRAAFDCLPKSKPSSLT